MSHNRRRRQKPVIKRVIISRQMNNDNDQKRLYHRMYSTEWGKHLIVVVQYIIVCIILVDKDTSSVVFDNIQSNLIMIIEFSLSNGVFFCRKEHYFYKKCIIFEKISN